MSQKTIIIFKAGILPESGKCIPQVESLMTIQFERIGSKITAIEMTSAYTCTIRVECINDDPRHNPDLISAGKIKRKILDFFGPYAWVKLENPYSNKKDSSGCK